MDQAHRVLVVDDEPIVVDVLTRYLTREGFEVATAQDGQEAVESIRSFRPDLVLLDLMLPRLDGLEVFRRIREANTVPVIMLTARGEETDRVVGLELGADDYVTKPFSPREIVARVRAVLRRAEHRGQAREALSFGDLDIDGRSREVRLSGTPVRLTPKEFDLLHFLASSPGQVCTRLDILEELWDFAFEGDPSTVTVHVRRLREKIEYDPSTPRHLVTVWGVGYRFDP
ncbi:MAG: response regulator transcription factor [Actinomycetota bacterium]|nr:response regulator transcription factor [Actinomycetota bacterium]